MFRNNYLQFENGFLYRLKAAFDRMGIATFCPAVNECFEKTNAVKGGTECSGTLLLIMEAVF